MYDQLLMRVLDRRADTPEHLQPFADAQLVFVTIPIERLALNVLHEEIWVSILGAAALQQAGYIGMIEVGKDLPFVPEPTDDKPRVDAPTYQLDGDLLTVLIVGAVSAIDLTHTARADLFHDLVGP